MITLASKRLATARASRESRFSPWPGPSNWVAIIGATAFQLSICTSSGSSKTTRSADSRRSGGSDIRGAESAPPTPRVTAWHRRKYQSPVVKTWSSTQSISSRSNVERVWSSTRTFRVRSSLLVGQLRVSEAGAGGLPIGSSENGLTELAHSARDEQYRVAEIKPSDDSACVESPPVACLRRQCHLPSVADLRFSCLAHGTSQCN